jgi:hypothetical protein
MEQAIGILLKFIGGFVAFVIIAACIGMWLWLREQGIDVGWQIFSLFIALFVPGALIKTFLPQYMRWVEEETGL